LARARLAPTTPTSKNAGPRGRKKKEEGRAVNFSAFFADRGKEERRSGNLYFVITCHSGVAVAIGSSIQRTAPLKGGKGKKKRGSVSYVYVLVEIRERGKKREMEKVVSHLISYGVARRSLFLKVNSAKRRARDQ